MYHPRIATSAVARALAAVAMAGGGLAVGGTALALTATSPAAAAESPAMQSVPVSYSCDFGSYQSGLAPLTVSTTMSAPSTVTAGTPMTVSLNTANTAIPAATAAALPSMSSLSLNGTATTSGAATMEDSLSGQSASLAASGPMSALPALDGTGTMTPRAAGTLQLNAPSSISLVPTGASGTMAPVACTETTAVTVKVTVVTTSATGTGTSMGTTGSSAAVPAGAAAYACVPQGTGSYSSSPASSGASGSAPTTSMVPMRLSATGPNAMMANDQVSLTSTTPWASSMGTMAGESMSGATPAGATASLGLEGASAGSIPLTASMHGGKLALTGTWQPRKTGMFRLVFPHRFQIRMRTKVTTSTVVVVCTTTVVKTTTVKVAMPAAQSSPPAPDSQSSAPVADANAPNTGAGGSLHSPVDMALLAVGIVAVMGGGVAIALAIRRRGRALI